MDPTADLSAEAIYTSPNGRVRVHYRTVMTAEDDMKRRILESGFMSDTGDVTMRGEHLVRFCLDRFCNRVELLDEQDGVVTTHEYTPELLGKLTGLHAEGGWTLQVSMLIYKNVLKRIGEVETLKKTSPEPSAPSSLASPSQETNPKPSSTSI